MFKKSTFDKKKSTSLGSILRAILIGAALGALIGALSGIGFILLPAEGLLSMILLGASVGAIIGGLYGVYARYMPMDYSFVDGKPIRHVSPEPLARLRLREEQLEISKELVDTGDVRVHTEVVTEEKTVKVPIQREEMVIEVSHFDEDEPNPPKAKSNVIRFPIREEQIEVVKHPVDLADVTISRSKYEEMEHITESLKKERLHIDTKGDAPYKEEDE